MWAVTPTVQHAVESSVMYTVGSATLCKELGTPRLLESARTSSALECVSPEQKSSLPEPNSEVSHAHTKAPDSCLYSLRAPGLAL